MSASSSTFETGPIRVLLIEDDPAQAHLIEHLLQRSSRRFEIEWVDRLSLAIERIAEGGLDVVVVDLGLPDSQGIDTFDAVRAADAFLPAVVMTSTDCEELATEAVRRGAQDYIVKRHHSGPTISRALLYAVERKRLEDQLRQSQKMEAVGALAGGVAHEFNNLLQAIVGYTKYAMEGLPTEDPRYRDLSKALDAAERATSLTRQLLNFSRHDGPTKRETNVAELIANVSDLVAPLLGDRWHLDVELPFDDLTLIADAGMLQQALMNLCINAHDAMRSGGTVAIESRQLRLGTTSCATIPGATPGDYVLLAVRDTGCGIPPELRERILEPFFTTKAPGCGTGLGLAMVYSIVTQHGGHLRIESELGVGSTFSIFLPKRGSETPADETAEVTTPAFDKSLSIEGSTSLADRLLLPQSI
ncbi:MAG: ATP-binding protein [Planctomycetota bacterium]|nr:ATP-binding protein [Planctomycetota bacterium]